jgi:pimeloyl-ACP methyl ester carboxylesterase
MTAFRIYTLTLLFILSTFGTVQTVMAESTWLTLPPTPTLPATKQSGYTTINGAKIWYAVYGKGEPVILLHGGLANSNYWGYQVRALAKKYQVIVMDSRGHGRSSNNNTPYNYDTMTQDVLGLMDFLKIKQAAFVGWSDGGIIGINMAINHPERITKLFAFGANTDPNGVHDPSETSVFKTYVARAAQEYQQLSPTPKNYQDFMSQIEKMWGTQPNITQAQLNSITTPTWISDGDRDEGIKRENTEFMAAQIPNAGLLILPQVSHFAFIQDPEQFNRVVLHFLELNTTTKNSQKKQKL